MRDLNSFDFESGDRVHLGGQETECIDIQVLSRSSDQDFWDGNWLACEVQVRAGGFRGSFSANLRTEEFERFYEGVKTLYESLKGEATLVTLEEQVTLTLHGDGHGHIAVRAQLRDAVGTGNVFNLTLQIDQTHLFGTMVQLSELLNRFPVRGSRSEP